MNLQLLEKPWGRPILLVSLIIASCAPPRLSANPLGGVVAAGSATISGSGSTLTIQQSSANAIINWTGFSIGAAESTVFRFTGPAGADSAVLNRVVGLNLSELDGNLLSYVGASGSVRGGSVFLINPNGIVVGPTGYVSVGSFIASTLDVSDQAFLSSSKLTLAGESTAGIQNQGTISVDRDVYLFAQSVQNSGTISGKDVGLAAGTEIPRSSAISSSE